MSYYRLPNLDLPTRINLAMQMLDPSRPWGLVTPEFRPMRSVFQ